jgi:hypothetical protein
MDEYGGDDGGSAGSGGRSSHMDDGRSEGVEATAEVAAR